MAQEREFFASFDNPIKGAPFVAYELVAMYQWVGDNGQPHTIAMSSNLGFVKGKAIFSLFGRYALNHSKKGRECVGDFNTLTAALETMEDMGIINHHERLMYDTEAQTKELFPDR